MSADILEEHAKGASLSSDVLAALIRQGIDMNAICSRVARGILDPPRLDRVVFCDDGGFEFARYRQVGPNKGAMIFVTRDYLGDAIDLVAWSPPHPPALWCSRGAILGGQSLFTLRMTDGLPVHPTPLEWLRDACRGVVIINEIKAAPLLRRAQPLQVSSIERGRALSRMLAVPPARIVVRPFLDRGAA